MGQLGDTIRIAKDDVIALGMLHIATVCDGAQIIVAADVDQYGIIGKCCFLPCAARHHPGRMDGDLPPVCERVITHHLFAVYGNKPVSPIVGLVRIHLVGVIGLNRTFRATRPGVSDLIDITGT